MSGYSLKVIKPTSIALGCALLLVIMANLTREGIRINEAEYATRQLREMVPGSVIQETGVGTYTATIGSEKVATIKTVQTMKGYNGLIKFLVAYSPNEEVISVRTISHKETPGLGDIIDIEVSDWMTKFSGRSKDNTHWLLRPEGDIDGVSGATITAKAAMLAIEEALP